MDGILVMNIFLVAVVQKMSIVRCYSNFLDVKILCC